MDLPRFSIPRARNRENPMELRAFCSKSQRDQWIFNVFRFPELEIVKSTIIIAFFSRKSNETNEFSTFFDSRGLKSWKSSGNTTFLLPSLVFLRKCNIFAPKPLFSLRNTIFLLKNIGFPWEIQSFCSKTSVFHWKYNLFRQKQWFSLVNAIFLLQSTCFS